MKLIISEEQLRKIILNEQQVQSNNLTSVEQTMLGFLSRFLRGEDGEFQNTPSNQLKNTMVFNQKTINPMVQSLIIKKNTGKKTYNDGTFNALDMTIDKAFKEMATEIITDKVTNKVTKKFNEQKYKDLRFEFYQEGGKITKIEYHSQY